MRLNTIPKRPPVHTWEGGPASNINTEQQLRRSLMTCMLWEDQFYESGKTIAQRIAELVPQVRPEFAAACAWQARTAMKLRHAPLLVVREMARCAKHKHLVGKLLADVIQRPDEIAEFLAIYWSEKKQPLSAQVKRGLAAAFTKFDEYSLAKYDREGAVKLRDALFLCHAKPADVLDSAPKFTKLERKAAGEWELTPGEQLFRKIVERKLETPDTWEVALSSGADKRATFERLMADKNLFGLAFLRNLRNMTEAGVERSTLKAYGDALNFERVLPFRFIAAARVVPQLEDIIEPWMLKCLEGSPKLAGKTVLLVDVSGSMDAAISSKSDLQRIDAACGLAMLLHEVCEEVEIITFSSRVVSVPPRRGFALCDAILQSQTHASTYLGQAVHAVNTERAYDRLICISDEQSADRVEAPKGKAYMLNVASYKNGVGYGAWTHIDGWSEAVVDFIREFEAN